jgi:hypothetical protein
MYILTQHQMSQLIQGDPGLWIPWAQKCGLGESYIKKAMQAFVDFLVPPEMRELLGFSNARFANFEKGMDKQAEKAFPPFQHVGVLLEEVWGPHRQPHKVRYLLHSLATVSTRSVFSSSATFA